MDNIRDRALGCRRGTDIRHIGRSQSPCDETREARRGKS